MSEWQSLCSGQFGVPLSFTGLLKHVDGWANARRWLARGRGSQQEHRALSTLSLLLLRFTSPRTPLGSECPSPLGLGINRSSFEARVMDATIYQIIFGDLGDLNCSLIDAFQDTFLENASSSLLSTDGKIFSSLFSCPVLRGVASCIRETISVRIFYFTLFFPSQGLYYCNATTDEIGTCWPRSSTGRIVERPCPEYINGVKYNTTSKIFSWQKFFIVRLFG